MLRADFSKGSKVLEDRSDWVFDPSVEALTLLDRRMDSAVDHRVDGVDVADPARIDVVQDGVLIEWHIVYKPAFRSPCLFVRASQLDGSPCGFSDLAALLGWTDAIPVTQAAHPVLDTPFWSMHPCETHSAMTTLFGAETVCALLATGDYLSVWLRTFCGSFGVPLEPLQPSGSL